MLIVASVSLAELFIFADVSIVLSATIEMNDSADSVVEVSIGEIKTEDSELKVETDDSEPKVKLETDDSKPRVVVVGIVEAITEVKLLLVISPVASVEVFIVVSGI